MKLEDTLGYTFKQPELLQQALTHSSYVHENGLSTTDCYERLEFLGDAVLELTISDYLYNRYNRLSEGELTKYRAVLVCEASLAELARALSLGEALRLGRGEYANGGRERDSLLADALEAVFGAVYVDGGNEQARQLIFRLFTPVAEARLSTAIDYKTTLQEVFQKNNREPAVYVIVDETGPAHNKLFTASVSHVGQVYGTGSGKNKKEAEQQAAKAALERLQYNSIGAGR